MKTLTDHTIIYDDECPMCKAYTKAFVKAGMLDSHGREAFTEVVDNLPHIDWKRAKNEIAMINKKDNSVLYGVDSITAILGNSMPSLKPLFNFSPFYKLLQYFYFFISYNRKVIVPGKKFEDYNTCTPDLNYTYRWAYILFAWLVTSMILLSYFQLAVPLVPESSFMREFMVCGGQIIFQGIIVALTRRDRWIHYLGNVMTVSLGGALLLTPMFLLTGWITSNLFYVGYFMIVVGLMFLEHMRRVKILELPWYISVTWILYRFFVLVVILNL